MSTSRLPNFWSGVGTRDTREKAEAHLDDLVYHALNTTDISHIDRDSDCKTTCLFDFSLHSVDGGVRGMRIGRKWRDLMSI